MTAQHTPIPWVLCDDGGLCLHSPERGSIGQVWTHLTAQSDGTEERANADFIIRAVNSHALMLEALKAIGKWEHPRYCPVCGERRDHTGAGEDESCPWPQAEAAIRAATGEDA